MVGEDDYRGQRHPYRLRLAVNVIRITITGIMYILPGVGPDLADRVFHDMYGWFMMPVAGKCCLRRIPGPDALVRGRRYDRSGPDRCESKSDKPASRGRESLIWGDMISPMRCKK